MAYDGNGNFVRLYDWEDDAANSIDISATRMDAEFDGIATALSQVLVRDGQVAMTGTLPMGGNKITGLGSGLVGGPAIAFASATTSGIYWNGTGVGLVNGGTERLTVTTTGVTVTGTLGATTINNSSGVAIQYNGTTRITTTSAGITTTGKVTTAASATGGAGLNLPHGTAPTSPVNGDVWTTTSGLYARINSATVGPFGPVSITESGTSMWAGTGSGALGSGTNTAFGLGVLPSVTGADSTGVGYNALNDVTGGNGNTAVGRDAGSKITTGSYNTLFGSAVMATGSGPQLAIGNTIVGYGAATELSGDYNVAIGYSAFAGTKSGDYNVSIGYHSGSSSTSGDYNTSVGTQSGNALSSAYNNTLIGYNAGSAITTGDYNTIVGTYAGTTTLASNVVLADGNGNARARFDGTRWEMTHDTTANAANAVLDSSTLRLQRSTSSLKYKRDVVPMEKQYAKALLALNPIFYKSAVPTDNQEHSYYGLAAEELDTIEPRFVQYRAHEDDWEWSDEAGGLRPIPNARMVPDGIAYDRMVVPLLMLVKDLEERLAKLERKP